MNCVWIDIWYEVGFYIIVVLNIVFIFGYLVLIMGILGWIVGFICLVGGVVILFYNNYLLGGLYEIGGKCYVWYWDFVGYIYGFIMYKFIWVV